MLSLICGICKEDTSELICRTETDSQTEKLKVTKGTGQGEGGTGGLEWKYLEVGCNDGFTTITKFIELKEKRKKKNQTDRSMEHNREPRNPHTCGQLIYDKEHKNMQ